VNLSNPYFDVKPLASSDPSDVIVPETGAEFRWNPMVESTSPTAAGGSSAASPVGAFFAMRTDDVGDIYLAGGNVSGGTGNESVSEILLYTASTDSWAGSSGQHVQLAITGDGQVTSGILDPVFNVTAASATVVSSIGANTLPAAPSTISSLSCKISLGTFYSGGFNPSAAGDVNVSFCWGGYSPTRI